MALRGARHWTGVQAMLRSLIPCRLWRFALVTPVFLAACVDIDGAGLFGRCDSLFADGRAPIAPITDVLPLCEEDGANVFFATGYARPLYHGGWSAYRLDETQARATLDDPLPRPRLRFRRNPKLDANGTLQPTHDDYTGTGWDRGHLAPNGALAWNADAQRASFTVANIAPQSPKMNRNIWRCFEVSIREWAAHSNRTFVVVGTVDGGRAMTGERDLDRLPIAVPTHFIAVVYRTAPNPIALGVMVPNEPGHRDIRRYVMSVAALEERTGYRFGLAPAIASRQPDLAQWPTRVVTKEYLGRLPPIDKQCPPAF